MERRANHCCRLKIREPFRETIKYCQRYIFPLNPWRRKIMKSSDDSCALSMLEEKFSARLFRYLEKLTENISRSTWEASFVPPASKYWKSSHELKDVLIIHFNRNFQNGFFYAFISSSLLSGALRELINGIAFVMQIKSSARLTVSVKTLLSAHSILELIWWSHKRELWAGRYH